MAGQQGRQAVQRRVTTPRYLDRAVNPPAYVDAELPTVTKDLLVLRRGRVRAPRGTITGSLRLTGSYRPFNPGSYSLRVTRLSLATGSRLMGWYIRHSRTGTKDIIDFQTPGQETRLGAPLEPIYSFGPGTIFWGWLGDAGAGMGSAYFTSQHIEGVIG